MIGDELRGAEVAKLGAVDDDEAVRIPPRPPRRLDHAAHVVGMIVCARELDPFLAGRRRIAAQAHFANGEYERVAKRIRIGEQLEAARVFLELIEPRSQRRVARVGRSRSGAATGRDGNGRQLDRQMSQPYLDHRRASLAHDDLRVERCVADLSDTEDVGAGGERVELECTGRTGEPAARARRERHDAEPERLARLGAAYGAAHGWWACAGLHEGEEEEHSYARGESRTLTGLPPGDFESPASALPPLGPHRGPVN